MLPKPFEIKEGLSIAVTAIKANKMRSVLTTLGIVIGIVVVTLMATVIEGLGRALDKSIDSLGSNVLYISKWDWFSNEWWKSRNRRDITIEEAEKLKERFTLAAAVVPTVSDWREPFKYGNKTVYGNVMGTTEEYVITSGVLPENGRFFNALESESGRPICVIGATVADNLFQRVDPIGKTIKVAGHSYRVIGVFEKEGSFLGSDFFSSDTQVFIPIQNFFKNFGTERSITINVKLGDGLNKEDAKAELIGAFRHIRKVPADTPDDFGLNTQDFLKDIFDTIVGTIGVIGFLITGLSLLVGGVGIMNIMFVSVKERTKEIGTRMAIGARRSTILIQFVIEAAVLCFVGGLLGVAISYPLSLIINQFLTSVMPLWVVVLSLSISIIIGLISGIMPAYTASKMDPVEALRYE